MTQLAERLLHHWCRAALPLLLALLASCGPGTGGTGTGPIAFSGGLSGAAVGGATPGAACACTQADLRLEDGQVELLLPCGRFVFSGQWDPQARLLVLPGRFESGVTGASPSVTAMLRLQFDREAASSGQVTVSVDDASGAALASALVLLRRDAAAAAACAP